MRKKYSAFSVHDEGRQIFASGVSANQNSYLFFPVRRHHYGNIFRSATGKDFFHFWIQIHSNFVAVPLILWFIFYSQPIQNAVHRRHEFPMRFLGNRFGSRGSQVFLFIFRQNSRSPSANMRNSTYKMIAKRFRVYFARSTF